MFSACKKHTLSIDATTQTKAFNAGTTDVIISSNAEWTAYCDQLWCKLSVNEGEGNGKVTITYDENTTNVSRVATILFSAKNGNAVVLQLTQNESNVICEGKTNNNSYFPAAVGNKWVYANSITKQVEYTNEIVSEKVLFGKKYFVHLYYRPKDIHPDTNYFRIAPITNIKFYVDVNSGTETTDSLNTNDLHVGDVLSSFPNFTYPDSTDMKFYISDINANTTTPNCTYSNCSKVLFNFPDIIKDTEYYYKRGIGLVKWGKGVDEIYLLSVTIN